MCEELFPFEEDNLTTPIYPPVDDDKHYFNVSAVDDLGLELVSLTDTVKYLYSVDPNSPDDECLNTELAKSFESMAANCEEFLRVFEYYRNKKTPHELK